MQFGLCFACFPAPLSSADPNHETIRPPPGKNEWMRSDVAVSPLELREAPKEGDDPADHDEKSNGDVNKEPSNGKPRDNRGQTKRENDPDRKSPPADEKGHAGKWILLAIGAVVLIAGLAVGIPWYLNSRHFESTDDAFVDAHYEKIAPQVSGRVIRVLANDNQLVGAGDLLLEIDPADYRASVEQAQAALIEAQARVGQQQAQELVAAANVAQARADDDNARATRDNAALQLKRYEGLTDDARVQQRLDDLRTTARSAAAQLAAAEQKVSAMLAQVSLAKAQTRAAQATVGSYQAQLDLAKLRLSYCQVRATVAGKVTNRTVQAGDYVATAQQVLLLVPHEVWVTANFKETQLTDMRPGQAVDLSVDAFPDVSFKGKVDSIQKGSGSVFSLLPPENASGNYVKVVQRVPVKITFEDPAAEPYRLLGPGMSVVPKVRVR
jgi:membrane fusion protein (multidrug efflux system)